MKILDITGKDGEMYVTLGTQFRHAAQEKPTMQQVILHLYTFVYETQFLSNVNGRNMNKTMLVNL